MEARKPRERLLGPALRTQPDRRLVELARDGSEPAQEEIVRRYRAALVRYSGSIVGAAAAEDVVQEALAKATRALGRVDGELRLRPWLYAIVRNTALNHLRDAGPATEQLDEGYDGVEQPPQALERRERVRSLVGGLRRLPQQQREALVKRELEGRSHEEIGAQLGVSSGAARQLIFRARESLRVGFGSLLPMPLLRWLAEGGGDGPAGVAASAGGGALAAKTAVAVFAAGAAVTAGVAIDHGAGQRPEPAAGVRPAVVASAGGVAAAGTAATRPEPVVAEPGSGRDDSAVSEDRSGRGGGGSSGRGPGERRAVHDGRGGGPGPSESSGPGPSGGDEGSGGERHERSGRGGPGSSDGRDGHHDDLSGSGRNDGGGKRGGSGSGGSGSGSRDGSGSGSGGSGSSGSGSVSGSSGSSGSGSGGSSGGEAVSPAPAPTSSESGSPIPAPAPVESGSGGSGSSGRGSVEALSEVPRDLSGGSVSQGSYDPD